MKTLLTVCAGVLAAATSFAQSVQYDGKALSLDPSPTRVGDTWLLPVRSVSDRIGARIVHDSRYTTITWGRNRAELQSGDSSYLMNGSRRRMRYEPMERRGVLFVEAAFFEELTDGRVRLLDDRYDRRGGQRYDPNARWDDRYGRPGYDAVYFDSRELRFDRGDEPYRSGSTLLVPFRKMGELTGARTDRTADGKRLLIRYGRNDIVYDKGRNWFRINGQRQSVGAVGEDRRGTFFVPIEVFQAVTDGRVSWGRPGSRFGK